MEFGVQECQRESRKGTKEEECWHREQDTRIRARGGLGRQGVPRVRGIEEEQ